MDDNDPIDWITRGTRVRVYENPYSTTKLEGVGTVLSVSRQVSDYESAYVEVTFDGEEGSFHRWVRRSHILKREREEG